MVACGFDCSAHLAEFCMPNTDGHYVRASRMFLTFRAFKVNINPCLNHTFTLDGTRPSTWQGEYIIFACTTPPIQEGSLMFNLRFVLCFLYGWNTVSILYNFFERFKFEEEDIAKLATYHSLYEG